ncbi:TetR family transcriptional regulator [Flexivirga sp. ID2601S]|uniref:TetR family transcriptional regulator n=1 Tax=Flexivirga aerilata TaxID=1656889 RepID=A0A849AMY5_9MICO|nr:TetR family transcriptional regulator [Flexivirga aerilata]NNG39710.1 TetR family transcriptional regulator [Flexivirga aerilata]
MSSTEPAQPGLRERKKAQTRRALREAAFRLFDKQGYSNTTTEQIAAAADVSPSTFFRYFPSKAELVVADDLDPLIVEAFRKQPEQLPVLRALRAAIEQVIESITPQEWEFQDQRWELMRSEDELRGAQQIEVNRTMRLVTDLIAERTELSPDDLRVRAMAGALIGGYLSMGIAPGAHSGFDLVEFFESGMTLDGPAEYADPESKRLWGRRGPRHTT